MKLRDKVCLITGSAAGIGKATAEKFIAEGATVILADVNQEVGGLGDNGKACRSPKA